MLSLLFLHSSGALEVLDPCRAGNDSQPSSRKFMKPSIAFAEHWMSHLRDQQWRRKMKQLYLQCAILRFMLELYLGTWHNQTRSCGLGFFCFEVHEADSDEHVVILQGHIQKSRLVLREPLTAKTLCPRSWWHLYITLDAHVRRLLTPKDVSDCTPVTTQSVSGQMFRHDRLQCPQPQNLRPLVQVCDNLEMQSSSSRAHIDRLNME